ncbi:MAG: leucine-rich repeat domain-containing protein, partial [Clostridiales bacterium]|nr:leucine-rich repeat domain-containing protein [Clostridiales bacterium]
MAKNSIKRLLNIIAVTLLAVLCMAVVVACGQSDNVLQKLPTPDKPEKNGGIVTWNNDPLYVDFVVSVDGVEYETSENSFDVTFAIKEGETFDVKVKALGDGKYYADSDWSAALTIAPISLTMELITNKNEYKIKKCNVASGDIVLPQMYNELPVTEIGTSAFSGCSDITGVTIPDGIREIGGFAFRECVNLERVNISDSVTEIDDYAFAECEKLRAVNIHRYVSKIRDNIFRQSGMADLTVDADNPYYKAEGNCLIRKSDNAIIFANENSTIPSDVDTIEQLAIWSDNLEELIIPNGVKKLANSSIWCDNLKRVQIPVSVTDITRGAFVSRYNLSEFIVAEDNPVYKSDCGHIIRKSDNVLMFGCSGNIVIPDYVTGIADCAFYCTNTQSTLFIPKSVTWIGRSAFMYCRNLKYVYLPNTLVELDNNAFERETDDKGYYVYGVCSITAPDGCVVDQMGWVRVFSSPDCEIDYDDGYAYVYARYYTLVPSSGTINYNLNSVIHWEDYIDYGDFPYRYGY